MKPTLFVVGTLSILTFFSCKKHKDEEVPASWPSGSRIVSVVDSAVVSSNGPQVFVQKYKYAITYNDNNTVLKVATVYTNYGGDVYTYDRVFSYSGKKCVIQSLSQTDTLTVDAAGNVTMIDGRSYSYFPGTNELSASSDNRTYFWADGNLSGEIANGKDTATVYEHDKSRPSTEADPVQLESLLNWGRLVVHNKNLCTRFGRDLDFYTQEYSFDGNGRVIGALTTRQDGNQTERHFFSYTYDK